MEPDTVQNPLPKKYLNLKFECIDAILVEENTKSPYTKYKFKLSDSFSNNTIKVISKRFREFVWLHNIVQKKHMNVTLPKPPAKGLFENKNDPKVQARRKVELTHYLQALQATSKKIYYSFPVRYFLRLVDLEGQTIMITGASSGIGYHTAFALAEMGARLIFACRDQVKTQPLIEEMKKETGNPNIYFMYLELSDLSCVRDFVTEFKKKGWPLHCLINNAGIGGAEGLSKDGFEITMAVNYIAPFLLTNLLIEELKAGAPSKIINVTSSAHVTSSKILYEKVKEESTFSNRVAVFKQSKLALVMMTKKLAQLLKDSDIAVFAVHPGFVATRMWRELPKVAQWASKKLLVPAEEGAMPIVHLVCEGKMENSGEYFEEGRVSKVARLAEDGEERDVLWEKSRSWVGFDDEHHDSSSHENSIIDLQQ